MKQKMNINFETMTDIEKSLFMFSYLKDKANEIISNMPRINSSRDKDEECYRWRFANNEALVYELELMNHKINSFKQEIQDRKHNKMLSKAMELDALLKDYNALKEETNRAVEERIMFADYKINFDDLTLNIAGLEIIFDKLPKEQQERIIKGFYDFGKVYKVFNESTPKQLGE